LAISEKKGRKCINLFNDTFLSNFISKDGMQPLWMVFAGVDSFIANEDKRMEYFYNIMTPDYLPMGIAEWYDYV